MAPFCSRSSIDKARPPEATAWDASPPKSPRSPHSVDGATGGFDYNAKSTPPSPKLAPPEIHVKAPTSERERQRGDKKEPGKEDAKVSAENNVLTTCKIKPKRDSTRRKLKTKGPEVQIDPKTRQKQNGVKDENGQENNKLRKDNKTVNDALSTNENARKVSPRRAGKISPVITPVVDKRSKKLEEKSTKDSGIIMDDFDQIQQDLNQIQSNISEMEENLNRTVVEPKKDTNSKIVKHKPPTSSASPTKPALPKKPVLETPAPSASTSKASGATPSSKSGGKEKEKEKESKLTGTLRRKKQGLQNHMRALVSKFENR